MVIKQLLSRLSPFNKVANEILLDEKGIILTWNKELKYLNGYEEEEMVGQYYNRLYTAEDRNNRFPEGLLETAKSEGSASHTGRYLRKDGRIYLAELKLAAIRNGKDLLGFHLMVR